MAKPTIAIILGAAATTEHYASLCSALEAKGYPTACGDPPSITVEDATIVTIQDDVDFVRSKVLAPLLAEGKDVVVVAHSYGGGYGAAALEGLSKRERTKKGEEGGVVGVIYLAAFCIDPGESTLQALEMDPSNPKPGIAPGDKPGTLTFTDAKPLWPSLPDDEAAMWLKKLRPCAVSAIAGPIPYAPYKDPYYTDSLAFVSLEDDVILTKDLNEKYLEKSGITLTRSIPGGHGINFESRDRVVHVVLELIGIFLKN